MDLEMVALRRARAWVAEKRPARSRCTKKCDVRKLMSMYRCYGPQCRAHCHHVGLVGWIMWHWGGGADRYFCSRQCYLDRLIKHLGGENKASRYIRTFWFKRNDFTELCDDISQLGDELQEALEELEELIDEQ